MAEEKKEPEKEEPDVGKDDDVLAFILSGEQLTAKIKTKRGDFVVALPLPRDLRAIEMDISDRLGNRPMDSFSNQKIADIRAYATLDKVVEEAPGWWQMLDSAEDCPDDSLIMELYRGYLQFYTRSQKSIARSKFKGDDRVGKPRIKTEAVGSGAFQGIANR